MTADEVTAQLPAGIPAPEGLVEAFWAAERALSENDLEELERFLQASASTLRADGTAVLVGVDRIAAVQAGKGGAQRRHIDALHVRPVDADAAVIVAVTRNAHGGRGLQTQLWRRTDGRWAVEVAHVTPPPVAVNPAIWRLVGTPLLPPTADGPLDRATVAVKDVFEIEGERVGAGVREFLAESPRATSTAPAVQALLNAGAAVLGIAQTDQFAYSIAGANPQYGTPPNPVVPGALSGGSTSGPAVAVALGQATIGLGTDTAGSIRVPASYLGLWGLRTTHDAVSRDGMLPLAPDFDTVGWLTRSRAALDAAARVTLPPQDQLPLARRFAIAPGVTAHAEPEVQWAFQGAVHHLEVAEVDFGSVDALAEVFRTVQAAQAWRTHGAWIERHPGVLANDVAARFGWAAGIGAEQEAEAILELQEAAALIRTRLAGRILLLPAASSAAPQVTASRAEIERTRSATLRLTCIAGIAGLPALSVPALGVPGPNGVPAPVGLSLVGPRHTDLALIRIGAALFDRVIRNDGELSAP